MFLIRHERKTCIGCGACAAVFPEAWQMDDDGSATLAGGRSSRPEEDQTLLAAEAKRHREAASVCPIGIIQVTEAGPENDTDRCEVAAGEPSRKGRALPAKTPRRGRRN
jgi:ferredoxin